MKRNDLQIPIKVFWVIPTFSDDCWAKRPQGKFDSLREYARYWKINEECIKSFEVEGISDLKAVYFLSTSGVYARKLKSRPVRLLRNQVIDQLVVNHGPNIFTEAEYVKIRKMMDWMSKEDIHFEYYVKPTSAVGPVGME